ncbi:phage tail tape measure protein [Roseburia inulinivorans]|uniref:Phage tail tape measure protein n=1 Tax=Roseburia inulinivorans TaxID=360807 RepID=A0A3R6A218_9FIRM|nr:phage tail tape measure protein [Roseburia inulinivorans]RGQ50625.1 phage tail tape measure protein [Roseburia inulinivorans]
MAGASLRIGANTSEFTSQMKSMLTQMKLVTSEYKVEAAQAKALGSQTDLLKAKQTELTAKIKLQTDAIKLQQSHLADQKQKLTELQEKEQKLKEKVAELTKAYEESVKTTGKDSEESKKLKAQLEETGEEHAKAEKAVKKQEDAIAKNTIKVNESRAALADQQTELKRTEEELNSTGKKWTVFGQEITAAGNNMDETGKKTVSLGDIIKANLISSAIINGVKALANGLKTLATAAVGVGSDFESGMTLVAATMGITTEEIAAGSEEFDKLQKAAKEAGATTQFSATQAAEALNYMALAGYDADKSIETLPTVLNLAAAGGMDLATASDMVTDSMSALGDAAGTTESFVDKMAKTSQKSNTNVQQLGEAILTAGGTAKNLAGGVVEMNTVLGIFADNGVKGAEGGTALRNVILSLTAPTDKAKKQMEALGLQVFDANGNMRPLNETFNDLNGILGTMTQGEQTEVLNSIFNKVDLKSVNALLANSGERFDELSGYISDCDGAAADMAATMNDNLQGKVTILKSGLEGLGIAAYEKFKTPLTNAVENITEVIGQLQTDLTDGSLSGALEKIATGFGNMVEKASEIVAAILPTLLEGLGWIADNGETIVSVLAGIGAGFAVFKVATLINTVITAMQGFKAAVAAAQVVQALMNVTMAANPIILVVTLIAVLVAAIVGFIATNEDARAALVNVWEAIKTAIGTVVEKIVTFFTETIPNAFNKVINFVKSNNWQGLLLLLVNPFAGAFKLLYDNCEGFRNIINNLVEQIKSAFNGVVNFLKELPSKIWNAIISTVDAIREWALGLRTAAEEGITKLVTNAVTFFSELPNKIAYVIGFCLGYIIKFGIDLYTWATTKIPEFVNSVVTFMQQLPEKIWNAIISAVQKVTTWGENMKTQAVTKTTQLITNVVSFMQQLPEKIWNAIISAVQKVTTWGEQMRSRAVTAATNLLNQTITTLSQLPGKVWNAIVGAVQQVVNWGTQLAAKGTEAAKGLYNAVVNGVSSLPSKMAEIGSNIVSGIWNGISSGWDWLTGEVKSLAKSLLDGAKDALGIHSPSRLFRDLVGKMIPQGIGVGITAEMPTLQSDLKEELQGMTTKVAAEVNPVTAVKNTAKISTIGGEVSTKQIAKDRDITVIVYTTNTTTLDKKVIAKEVKKEVVKGITKDQNDKDKTKGAA